jgi:SAM-dependent methyltransferase
MKAFIKSILKKIPVIRQMSEFRDALLKEQASRLAASKQLSIHDFIAICQDTSSYENVGTIAQQDCSQPADEKWLQFDNVAVERTIEEYKQYDPFPLPVAADREGYFGERHYHYWLSGLKDYLAIKTALQKYGVSLDQSAAIFDFGCASGRVLRHFACHERGIDIWGADINIRHVEWVRRFLPDTIRIFQNSILPSLPIEDATCSLVYAFSVFTHIDKFELAWVAEIQRILKKGGIAYLTIHSDRTWNNIKAAEPLYTQLLAQRDHIQEFDVTPELFGKPMPREKTVFKVATNSIYNANVFHSTEYITSTWGRFMDVLEIMTEGHGYQDVVLLRK